MDDTARLNRLEERLDRQASDLSDAKTDLAEFRGKINEALLAIGRTLDQIRDQLRIMAQHGPMSPECRKLYDELTSVVRDNQWRVRLMWTCVGAILSGAVISFWWWLRIKMGA